MKKTLIVVATVITLAACNSTDKKTTTGEMVKNDTTSTMTKEDIEKAKNDPTNFTTIEWLDSTTRNLGNLKKDQEVEVTYRFKNSGDKVLVIENVTAACGCTIPEKPEQPIAPGGEGIIRAKFNGSGQGHITKTVTVVANTNPTKEHILTFTGDIEEKK